MINKYLLSGFIISICLFFTSGCSTIVYGSKQNVLVNSIPSGAEVILNGQRQKTPAFFKINGGLTYTVIASKDGYKTVRRYLQGNSFFTPRLTTTIYGNALNGLLLTGISVPLLSYAGLAFLFVYPIGIIVDYATGAAYKMPSQFTIPMEKE